MEIVAQLVDELLPVLISVVDVLLVPVPVYDCSCYTNYVVLVLDVTSVDTFVCFQPCILLNLRVCYSLEYMTNNMTFKLYYILHQ